MNIKYYPELQEIEDHKSYLPSISFILPLKAFDRSDKSFLKLLKIKLDELERKLAESYDEDLVSNLMIKFEIILKDLKPEKFKLGIAIFVSPEFQKIYYLDFEPEEKLVIGDSFEIRDLIYSKSLTKNAILLLLSANEIRYFLYTNNSLTKLIVDVPLKIEAFMENTLHDVAIYYEKNDRREKAMHLLLDNADKGLGMVLQSYDHDVIVTGSDKMIAHFKKISHHNRAVKAFLPGNYFEKAQSEVIRLVQVSLNNIREDEEKALIQSLEIYNNNQMLAIGLNDVWKQSAIKNCQLLVVEKNYRKAAVLKAFKTEIFTHDLDADPMPMQDVVDDVIENVISAGGKVLFVDDDKLLDYRHIVLVKNYV
ncbi:MAG: hypothetical protein WBB12_19525 [Saprospiraceae bacterium]